MTILAPTARLAPAPGRCCRTFNTLLCSLVLRLIRAQNDPVKDRLRSCLLAQTDERLRESLGFSEVDISTLRSSQFPSTKD
jgi:hypothetical protein